MIWVFQLRPLASTCARSRTSGLTATALATSRRIPSASSIVSVEALPQPERIPPVVKLPGKTVMTFSPRLATWASTCALAPLPMLTIAMTAPTPMIMPSAVRMERILLRRSARKATLIVLMMRMVRRRSVSPRPRPPSISASPLRRTGGSARLRRARGGHRGG